MQATIMSEAAPANSSASVPDHKACIGIRKKRAIRLSRKIVRVTVGPKQELFVIYEEFLCRSSIHFREKLQKGRKPVEGECSICHEEMRVAYEDIVFCRTCGGNLHHDCMKQWETQNKSDGSECESDPTCPLCRAEWEPSGLSTWLRSDLEAEPFAMYSEWLYSGEIALGDTSNPWTAIHNLIPASSKT